MDIWANLQPLKCHYALADGQILPQTSEHLVKNFYAESALHSFRVSSDLSLFTIFKYFLMLSTFYLLTTKNVFQLRDF